MALYDDVGGAPAVRAALDAFYPRALADATLSPFFLGIDIERLKKTQEGFFAMALGIGLAVYACYISLAGQPLFKGGLLRDT